MKLQNPKLDPDTRASAADLLLHSALIKVDHSELLKKISKYKIGI